MAGPNPINSVGWAARNAVITRLQDPTYGLNARLTALAPSYLVTDLTPYLIDWADDFYQGDLEPDQVLNEEDIGYPLFILFVKLTDDNKNLVNAMFSGTVSMTLRYIQSWPNENAGQDYDTPGDLVEHAIFQVFNMQPPSPLCWKITTQTPTCRFGWNGKLSGLRSPVTEDGENLRRELTYSMSIFVDVA